MKLGFCQSHSPDRLHPPLQSSTENKGQGSHKGNRHMAFQPQGHAQRRHDRRQFSFTGWLQSARRWKCMLLSLEATLGGQCCDCPNLAGREAEVQMGHSRPLLPPAAHCWQSRGTKFRQEGILPGPCRCPRLRTCTWKMGWGQFTEAVYRRSWEPRLTLSTPPLEVCPQGWLHGNLPQQDPPSVDSVGGERWGGHLEAEARSPQCA